MVDCDLVDYSSDQLGESDIWRFSSGKVLGDVEGLPPLGFNKTVLTFSQHVQMEVVFSPCNFLAFPFSLSAPQEGYQVYLGENHLVELSGRPG